MGGAESPERLPVGWTEQVADKDGEQVKFYYNVITGQKAYSKADLPPHVELGSPSQGTRQLTHARNKDNRENKLLPMPSKTNDMPDWLPQGWIVELNATSNGSKYKRYIDPTTGRKFNSKPEILRYLNSDKSNDPTSKQTATSETAMSIVSESNPHADESRVAVTPQKMEGSQTLQGTSSKPSQKEKSSSSSPRKKLEIVRCAAEGLPPGWIKEIKIERIGNKTRKDPYYTDPDSKYVFRSQPDAFRYLETKDPRVCAIKPRKREELKFLNDETSQSLDDTTGECIKNEENLAPSSGQPPRTPVSKRKRGRPVAAPSTNHTTRREKPAEIILNSKSKVASSPCKSSTRTAGSKSESVEVILGETEKNGEEC